MSSENKRTDEYWIGVRDALRMVDSFNKWASRNPGRAKSLEDFIHDGLIAAAKRCESCLSEKLGLSFAKGEQVETSPVSYKSPETEITPPPDNEFTMDDADDELFDVVSDSTYDIAVESKDFEASQEIHIESDESSFSIDSVERIENEPMDDVVIEGPQRDFTTDFVLVEPSPLEVDTDEQNLEESAMDEQVDLSDIEEFEVLEEESQEEEKIEKRTAFTWSEYEAAVTPSSSSEPLESEYYEQSFAEEDHIDDLLHEDEIKANDVPIDEHPESSESEEGWRSYDETSIDETEILEGIDEDEDEHLAANIEDTSDSEPSEVTTPITEPPAPPPPPESEEDEEERKRRARRLFFGT